MGRRKNKNKNKKGKGRQIKKVVTKCVNALVGKVTVKVPPKPTWHKPLIITEKAYQKIKYIIDLSSNLEVGGFGVAGDVEDLLRITDFRLIKQEVNSTTTELDDSAVNDYMLDMVEEGFQPCQCMRVWFHLHPFGVGVPHPSGQDDSTFKEQFDNCDFAVMLIFSKGNTPHVEFRQGEHFYDMECIVEGQITAEDRALIKADYDDKVSRKSYTCNYGGGWQTQRQAGSNYGSYHHQGGYKAGDVWDWQTNSWISKAARNARDAADKEPPADKVIKEQIDDAPNAEDLKQQEYMDYMYFCGQDDMVDVEYGSDNFQMRVMADGNIVEDKGEDVDGNAEDVDIYKTILPSNRMYDLTDKEYARVERLISQTTKLLGIDKKKEHALTQDEIDKAMDIVLKQIDKEWKQKNRKAKSNGQQKSETGGHSTRTKDATDKGCNRGSGGSGKKHSPATDIVRKQKFGAN